MDRCQNLKLPDQLRRMCVCVCVCLFASREKLLSSSKVAKSFANVDKRCAVVVMERNTQEHTRTQKNPIVMAITPVRTVELQTVFLVLANHNSLHGQRT